MPLIHLSTRVLLCICLSLVYSGINHSVHAAQNGNNEIRKNNPANVFGKITQIIFSSGITYAEVDTGKQKLWAATVGVTQVKKGDRVSFSTEMPMKNYHSKNLGRNFPIIFFVKKLDMEDELSTRSMLFEQLNKKQSSRPAVSKLLAANREVKVGDSLREVTLDGLQGKPKKFSEFKGLPLIINVWASWCSPCRAEMGSLQRLADRYNGKEFNIIGISTDDYRDRAIALIRQTGISFENFIDQKLTLEKMLGARTIPLTILVDDKGRILKKIHGAREWDSPAIIDEIEQAFQISLKR